MLACAITVKARIISFKILHKSYRPASTKKYKGNKDKQKSTGCNRQLKKKKRRNTMIIHA